ncbi:mucosa-associated lymphoid tissue lymphoma translocation protein 1-like [Artemia franciscana]|uniref:mucosa-associated lymphoid tissue lymphoma translocation protein 1-like n=1 Tax=Artemia franciscana TaxID=6661 RepID=UPI0032DA2C4E
MNENMNICDLNASLFKEVALDLQKKGGFLKLKAAAEELCEVDLDTHSKGSRTESEMLLILLGDFGCDVSTLLYLLDKCELWSTICLIKTEPIRLVRDLHTEELWSALGSKVHLSCEATSYPPPTYQWFKDEGEIPGSTLPDYEIDDLKPSDVGSYYCSIGQKGNLSANLRTRSTQIEIIPQKPVITRQPRLLQDEEGKRILIEAQGWPPLYYQWYQNGIPMGKMTHVSILKVTNENMDGQTYSCLVSNAEGNVKSEDLEISSTVDNPRSCLFFAREKVALLVGNSEYKSHPPLISAYHDVVTLTENLERLSFRVMALSNLSLSEMKNAVQLVAKHIVEGAYVVFYYGGHGFNFYGNDYLLPVDAPPNGVYKSSDSIDKDEIIAMLSNAKPRLLTVLLDTCRKSPTEEQNPYLHSERPRTYRYEPERNLIVGFATTAHLSAFGFSNQNNGIFVGYLKKRIRNHVSVRQLLMEVQHDFLRDPNAATHLQMPYISNNLAEELSLTDPIEKKSASNLDPFWDGIHQFPDPQIFLLENGGRVVVTYLRQSNCLLNGLEMILDCEKIMTGLLVRSSSQDVALTHEVVGSQDGSLVCKILVSHLQKLTDPLIITISTSNEDGSEGRPLVTINVGLPLISSLKLYANIL